MPAITVRNLSEETHRALKARAAGHGRSTEAEVRAILNETVAPDDRLRLGSLLEDIGRDTGGPEIEVARDKSAPEPVDLS